MEYETIKDITELEFLRARLEETEQKVIELKKNNQQQKFEQGQQQRFNQDIQRIFKIY